MARFKTTVNIFSDAGEYFDPNMMDAPHLAFPPLIPWTENRPMRIEDVDLWEVIIENGGPFGVYAAFMPHGELYIVVERGHLIQEYEGPMANSRLESYLRELKVPYPYEPAKSA